VIFEWSNRRTGCRFGFKIDERSGGRKSRRRCWRRPSVASVRCRRSVYWLRTPCVRLSATCYVYAVCSTAISSIASGASSVAAVPTRSSTVRFYATTASLRQRTTAGADRRWTCARRQAAGQDVSSRTLRHPPGRCTPPTNRSPLPILRPSTVSGCSSDSCLLCPDVRRLSTAYRGDMLNGRSSAGSVLPTAPTWCRSASPDFRHQKLHHVNRSETYGSEQCRQTQSQPENDQVQWHVVNIKVTSDEYNELDVIILPTFDLFMATVFLALKKWRGLFLVQHKCWAKTQCVCKEQFYCS